MIQGEERLALAEREKLKYRKLQNKADTLVKMQSLSKDQMEMDDIALHRFKNKLIPQDWNKTCFYLLDNNIS